MIPFEKLESDDFDYLNLPEDEQRPQMSHVRQRLEEFQQRLTTTESVARILKCCGLTPGEPWKHGTLRAGDRQVWFDVGGESSARNWHATVFFRPRGVDVEVRGAGRDLTLRLAKAGVKTVAELVRLCAESSERPLIAVGCWRVWYKDPESHYKSQRIDHTDEPLMGYPRILAVSTGDGFADVLFGLLKSSDHRYRTELIIRYSIPRENITNKDLSAQVGVVADALSKIQGPLEFLMNMEKAQPQWRWEDGMVDDGKEHFELRHGYAAESPYEDWLPIARIGKPKEHVFPMQWLVQSDSPENQAMLADAHRDMDFYLVESSNPDPWAYAQYHCNTAANMYSSIHWSYFPDGRGGKRVSSMVVELSTKESKELFGKRETDGGK